MNNRLLFTLAALPLAAQGTAGEKKEAAAPNGDPRPNILFFLVDDMGWQDTSVPFHDERTPLNDRYHTPNMERLARMGVRFTQAYACAVSSPSRCSILSGMNAARHRVTNWTLDYGRQTDASSDVLELPDWNWNGIQPDTVVSAHNTQNATPVTTLPQLLRENGYYTIHCGKAHFGAKTTAGADPLAMGFDVNIAGGANGAPGSYLAKRNFGQGSPQEVLGLEKYFGEDLFLTEVLTREAIEALKVPVSRRQPFYLYMAHYAVHAPYDEDTRFTARYRGRYDRQFDAPLNESETRYAALVEGMDKSLGDIMDWLEKNGEADNTIILFCGDNGGYATGKEWRDEPLYTQNAPLTCGKGSAYEGGIREPMIVSWPGVTKPNTRCDKYVIIEDYYPTILEMAGITDWKVPQTVDGVSFVPLLKQTGDPSEGRSLYWNCPNLWGEQGPGIGATCTVRQGKWKLIYFYETGKKELYDIPADISEQHNLAQQHPEVVKALSANLGEFLRSSGAQRPSFKKTGKPCPWPDEIE